MIPASLLLVFWPWGDDLWALPKLTAVCASLWWALATTKNPRKPVDGGPWAWALAAIAASTLFSVDLGNSLLGSPNPMGLGLFQWLVCGLVFCYGLSTDQEKVDREILFCARIMAAYAVAQGLGLEFPFLHPHALTGNRHGSTQGSPVFLGFMLVAVAPTVFRQSRGKFADFALLMGAAAAAKCRSALLAIPIVTVFSSWRKNDDN